MGVKKFNGQRFLKLLEKNGDIKYYRLILAAAEKRLLEKTGNKKIVLEIARPSQKKVKVGKKGDVIEERINPGLIAGIKIIVNGEKQLDFSLKNKLDKIFS